MLCLGTKPLCSKSQENTAALRLPDIKLVSTNVDLIA